MWYSRPDSNWDLRLRKPLLYPLNYGSESICRVFRVEFGSMQKPKTTTLLIINMNNISPLELLAQANRHLQRIPLP